MPSVGGKNASLGEMYRELMPQGMRVPNGFAITADAYRYVPGQAGIVARPVMTGALLHAASRARRIASSRQS